MMLHLTLVLVVGVYGTSSVSKNAVKFSNPVQLFSTSGDAMNVHDGEREKNMIHK